MILPIPELGQALLLAALLFSILTCLAPASLKKLLDTEKLAHLVTLFTRFTALFITLAFLLLCYAFAVSDFSVLPVFLYSHTLKPLIYKITGTWGNHEGSMLLWVCGLTLFGLLFSLLKQGVSDRTVIRTLATHALITTGFLGFVIFTSNPFVRLDPIPPEGQGLNPLLQDIGLALHPPALYLGYVGCSILFCLAVAALLEEKFDRSQARRMRPWALLSWGFLTVGIALGSWWAYRELGWGGWWFWDPVENASLMPWLTCTALVHCLLVTEAREGLKRWSLFLAILTFAFSLLGTFLVRSGVLTSVHAFANDPDRGLYILALLILIAGGGLLLFAIKGPRLDHSATLRPMSREGGILFGNLFILTILATIVLGTLYPLILNAFDVASVSVGAPYFNATFIPLALPVLLLAALGPLMRWKRAQLQKETIILWIAAGAVLIAGNLLYFMTGHLSFYGNLATALTTGLLLVVLLHLRQRIQQVNGNRSFRQKIAALPHSFQSMSLGHLGLGMLAAGMIGMGLFQQETQLVLTPGEETELAGYTFQYNSYEYGAGPNYLYSKNRFTISKEEQWLATLTPESRFYPVERERTMEAAIYSGWFYDLYIALGQVKEDGTAAVRLYYNPLISFLWLGASLIALAALVSGVRLFMRNGQSDA